MMTVLRGALHAMSAERTTSENVAMSPTFAQHQRTYSFCVERACERRVIDVGCGSGDGSIRLAAAAAHVTGLDRDERTIAAARRRHAAPNLEFVRANFNTYVPSSRADLAVTLQVIEHFRDPHPFLRRIAQTLLGPGGMAIISTPNAITQSYNENPYHYHEYTADELGALLREHFAEVTVLGLHGDARVQEYEARRKDQVLALLAKDVFKLRRLLPRSVLQVAGDLATGLTRRRLMSRQGIDRVLSITEQNFSIAERLDGAIDLVAVCRLA